MTSSETFLARTADLLLTHHRKMTTADAGRRRGVPELSLGAATDSGKLLDDIRAFLDHSPNVLTPKFMNQLFSGILPEALAGEWTATLVNATMATHEVSPVATLMEREVVRKLGGIIGWGQIDGIMVTGGSNANLYGMLVARNTLFPESKRTGNDEKKFCLFVSEEAHYSFEKAANLMGLGTDRVIKVAASPEGHLLPADLREKIQSARAHGLTPFFIAATAGTTVLGSYDPIRETAKVAASEGLWFHVDGAWGGGALLSEKRRALLDGIELADSFAWDPHKMLGTGLISSFFLTKHKGALGLSNNSGGQDYIFHDTGDSVLDSGPNSLQCGRRNDVLKVWLTWRALGDEGLGALVDRLFVNARAARDLVAATTELELLYEPEMLNICFRFRGEENSFQKLAREELLKDGEFFVNVATRRGETFFRLITVHPDMTRDHLTGLVTNLIRIKHRLKESL